MKNYSAYYDLLGKSYTLPSDHKMRLGTGQGWNSKSSLTRGMMSMLVHLLGRLLLGRRFATETGNVYFNIFQITPHGMLILKKCKDFQSNGPFVSISLGRNWPINLEIVPDSSVYTLISLNFLCTKNF